MVEDFMDSTAVVETVLNQFIVWQAEMCANFKGALAAQDQPRLKMLAHSLRGTLAQLHAPGGSHLASTIETLCQQRLDIPEDLVDCLFGEIDAITRESRHYLSSLRD